MSESLIHSDADLEEVRAHARWLEERAVMLQKENDRLRADIRELEAEKDAASIMPWIKRWKERAEKAEAERDALKALASQYLGWHKECEAERDAIEAATIEQCISADENATGMRNYTLRALAKPDIDLLYRFGVKTEEEACTNLAKTTQLIAESYDLGGEGAGDEP